MAGQSLNDRRAGRFAREPDAPILTVVIPAFNAEGTIERAVSSALNQDEYAIEVVVVDDGSTDDTQAVVSAINDKRLRVLYQTNAGPGRARNHGISLAHGEWIGLLDADDIWTPGRVSDLLSALPEDVPDLIADDVVFVDEDGRPLGTFFEGAGLNITPTTELDAASYLRGEIAGRPAPGPGLLKPIIRREFLRERGLSYAEDEDIRGVEDYLFYCACLLAGARFMLVPSAGYLYIRRPESLSLGNPLEFQRTRVRMFERLIQDPMVPASTHNSLQERLASARHMVSYYALRRAIRNRRLHDAVLVVIRDPTAGRVAMRRMAKRARERLRVRTRIRSAFRRRTRVNHRRPASGDRR